MKTHKQILTTYLLLLISLGIKAQSLMQFEPYWYWGQSLHQSAIAQVRFAPYNGIGHLRLINDQLPYHTKPTATLLQGLSPGSGQFSASSSFGEVHLNNMQTNGFYYNKFGLTAMLIGSQTEELEGDINLGFQFNKSEYKRFRTRLQANFKSFEKVIDANNDNFLDHPLGHRINLQGQTQINYRKLNIWMGVIHFSAKEQRGEVDFQENDRETWEEYGWQKNTTHTTLFLQANHPINIGSPKNSQYLKAYIYAHLHDQADYFGRHDYKGIQEELNARLEFMQELTFGQLSSGFQLQSLQAQNTLDDFQLNRVEQRISFYANYTATLHRFLNLSTRAEIGHHNLIGLYFSPTINLHFPFITDQRSNLTLTLSSSRDFRYANPFTEFEHAWTNNRIWQFNGSQPTAKWAWQFKSSIIAKRSFNYEWLEEYQIKSSFTHFRYDILSTWDFQSDASTLYFFYNNAGGTRERWDNQLRIKLRNDLQVKFNYFWDRLRSNVNEQKQINPFIYPHNFHVSLGYLWKNSFTGNLSWAAHNGRRLSDGTATPIFNRFNLLISSNLHDLVDFIHRQELIFYFGIDNMFNSLPSKLPGFEDPFGPTFNAADQYGNPYGRRFYLGVKYGFRK